MLTNVLNSMPLTGDDTENETVLKLAFELHANDNAVFMQHKDKIALTAVRCIAEEKCADLLPMKFKREVAKFIMSAGINDTFEALVGQMNANEKVEFEKFVQEANQWKWND